MIETTHLFEEPDRQLIDLLRSLTPEDWNRPTLAKKWTVKDIAAHLLDGNFRMLSLARDGHQLSPDREIHSYQDLVEYLNTLNADWTKAFRRISPAILIQLLEQTGREYTAYLKSLNPQAEAMFSVAWAGESRSKNWFHVAREYTEKWHHQQQIREATGHNGLMSRESFYPFIATLMLGMPHALRNTNAPAGTLVRIIIDTSIGGEWTLIRQNEGWEFSKKPAENASASITIQPEDAWKLFTKGKRPEDLQDRLQVSGDKDLVDAAVSMIAVMA